jgi:hypothetical protein
LTFCLAFCQPQLALGVLHRQEIAIFRDQPSGFDTAPRATKVRAKLVGDSVMASPQAQPSAAGAWTFIGETSFHADAREHLYAGRQGADLEHLHVIVNYSAIAVCELAERRIPVSLEVGVAVEVRDDAFLDEGSQGGRLCKDEAKPGRRSEAKSIVIQAVIAGGDPIAEVPNPGCAARKSIANRY